MHVASYYSLYNDVRLELVETTDGIVVSSSYNNCDFSLKMSYKAEIYR
jgi:hypothetical protein